MLRPALLGTLLHPLQQKLKFVSNATLAAPPATLKDSALLVPQDSLTKITKIPSADALITPTITRGTAMPRAHFLPIDKDLSACRAYKAAPGALI